jgi:tRNA threonylcarbamoyl adenosine modification protein YeaZ
VLVLALDTATEAVAVGLLDVPRNAEATVLASRVRHGARQHGEQLMPAVLEVCADAGHPLAQVDAVVCGAGPGPFTGLRVGLATAASMGQALGIPTYGVCTLDALGRAAGPGRVLVATDARRREVYWATYADGIRTTDPEVSKPADVLVDADRAVGEGALKYSEVFGLPIDELLLFPPGVALVALAAERIRGQAPSEPLTPLYLRRPDAVESAGRKHVLQ